MALRNGIRGFSIFSSSFRNYSSTGPVINLQVNDKTGVATVTLNRPPVNSLNLELLTELSNTLTELEKNKCRGLMLTSVFLQALLLFLIDRACFRVPTACSAPDWTCLSCTSPT
jgi:hypothetical protein